MTEEVTYDQLIDVLYSEDQRYRESSHQFQEDLKEPTAWLPAFLALMWLTGARVSETLAIRGQDIKPMEQEGRQVVVVSLMNLKQRHNATKESIVVPDQYPVAWAYVENYLAQLENPNGLMFHKSRVAVWQHCKRIFDLGTHRVGRHSWVMNQARRGAQILDVKQMGGWSRLQSMDPYIHKFGRKELVKRMLEQKD